MLASVRESALGRMNFGDASGEGDAELELEAFRILYTNLLYLNVDNPPQRVLVTSALPEEGKSTVASSLAVVAGLAGRRVLLIETDLRRPVLAQWLGLEPNAGPGGLPRRLGRAARGDTRGRPGAARGQRGGGDPRQEPRIIAVIVAGEPPPRPAELLNSQALRGLRGTCRRAPTTW